MAYSTKFKLKEPNKNSDTLVYMTFTFNSRAMTEKGKIYHRVKVSTGEKINPDVWDFKKRRAKNSHPFQMEFNTRLEKFKNEVENIHRTIINNKEIPTVEAIKKKLDVYCGRASNAPPVTFLSFIDEYIKNPKLDEGKHLSESTIANYRTTKKHIENFAATKNKPVNFETIDLEFYTDFMDYMIKDLKMTINSAGKYIKTIKKFMNEATEAGVNANLKYKSKRFKVLKEEGDNIYLTLNELQMLFKCDLSENPKLDRVRDLFLIGAFTGLRFSDFTCLTSENIYITDAGEFLKVNTKKTGAWVVIPIHPIIKAILTKYHSVLPKSISNQKMNKYLKELCDKAKINGKVQKTQIKGGMRVTTTFEKSKLVSTHSARRSFATNAYLSGENPLSIMRITGHKTERSFMMYIQMTGEDNAVKMQNGEFFSGKGISMLNIS